MFEITKVKQLPEKCLFFGYGSLMFPKGINDRGLSTKYSREDIHAATILGFKRGMSAEWVINPRMTHTYYGIHEDLDKEVFGVLFMLHSKTDLITLLEDEYASPVIDDDPMYRLFDVSDKFGSMDTGVLPKLTLVCKGRKNKPETYAPNYVEFVYVNMPDRYRKDFLRTGGIKP